MHQGRKSRNPTDRRTTVTAVLGAAAVAGILISTLDIDLFRDRLALRAAVLAAGAVPALWFFFRRFPGGVIDHTNRRAILVAVLVVHALATLYFFPIDGLLNERPVVTLDHSFHYYQAQRAKEVFWETFRFDRYDPYFMAGYPGGTIFDLDMKGAELFCAFFPFTNTARALKIFILSAYLTMIATLYYGSRMQGFGLEETVLGLLVFLAYWHWGRPYAGNFRYAGMFSFVFASHLSFLLVGLLRQVAFNGWARLFLILGPVAFLVHPTSVVMLPIPFAVSIVVNHRRWRAKQFLLLMAWCLVVVFLNYIWLEPFFKYIWMKTTTEAYFQIGGVGGLLRIVNKPSCAIAVGMCLLALVGTWRMGRDKRLSVGLPALAGSAVLFFVAGAGVFLWGLNQLEPGRFMFTGFVFLTPLAGVGTRYIRNGVLQRVPWLRVKNFLRTAFVAVLGLSLLPLSLLEAKSFYRHTIRTAHPPKIEALIKNVKRFVDPSGRLMVEDGPAAFYSDAHLPALLPLATGVEQIGGPYPHTYLLYYFSTFQSLHTFGRPMNQWDGRSIRPYLELYNVRWILTATRESGRTVGKWLEGEEPLWSEPPFCLWEVKLHGQEENLGSPKVTSGINRITIEGGDTVEPYALSYHWVPGLSVAPPAEIFPYHRLDDPVPFIFVKPNGVSNFTITY